MTTNKFYDLKLEIDLSLLNWKRRVFMLLALEKKIAIQYNAGEITKKEKIKKEKLIGMAWDRIWDVYPNNPFSGKELLELGYG